LQFFKFRQRGPEKVRNRRNQKEIFCSGQLLEVSVIEAIYQPLK
jgi:hypothetical protein